MRRADTIQYGLAVVILAFAGCATLGEVINDPNKLCPPGMRFVGWDEGLIPSPLCECREGLIPKADGLGCEDPPAPPSPICAPDDPNRPYRCGLLECPEGWSKHGATCVPPGARVCGENDSGCWHQPFGEDWQYVDALPVEGDCRGPEDNEPAEGSPMCEGDPLGWEGCWACTGRSGGKWVYHERYEPPPPPPPPPTPTPCVERGGGWWADGSTDGVNGCGPTGMHACHPTLAAACRKFIEDRHLESVVSGGKRYFAWGDLPNPQYKWILEGVCTRHQNPGSPSFAGPDGVGVERTPGYEDEPCPDDPPPPTPTPTPIPSTCEAGPPTGMTIDVSCAGGTDCGIGPPGWVKGGPVPIRLNRKAWPPGWVVKLDVSYYRGRPGSKVHDDDPCYPGPITEWTNETLAHNCGDPRCHNDGSTPFPGKHVLRLDGGHTGKWRYTAHGALGLTASATLEVR